MKKIKKILFNIKYFIIRSIFDDYIVSDIHTTLDYSVDIDSRSVAFLHINKGDKIFIIRAKK